MGGAVSSGNTLPNSEFNLYQDPYAASIVLSAGFNDLVLVDLDGCMSGYLTDAEADRMLILKSKLGPLYEELRKHQRKYLNEYISEHPEIKENMKGKNIYYDAIAAAVAAMGTEVAEFEPCYVTCETQSSINYGQAIFDFSGRLNKKFNVDLVRNINRDYFVKMIFESLTMYLPDTENEKVGDI